MVFPHALVRFPGTGVIDKDDIAVVGNVAQQGGHLIPVSAFQLVQVHVVHLDEGRLGHDGNRVDRVGEGAKVHGAGVKAVQVEIRCRSVDQEFFQCAEIIGTQIVLFAVEYIKVMGLLPAQGVLQGLEGPGVIRFLCHVNPSVSCDCR